jgi:hypothetical protein
VANGDSEGKHSGGSYGAGQGKPTGTPSRLCDGNSVQSSADARKERGRDIGVGGGVKVGIDGGKKGFFFGEGRPARGANGEVCPQGSKFWTQTHSAGEITAAGSSLD